MCLCLTRHLDSQFFNEQFPEMTTHHLHDLRCSYLQHLRIRHSIKLTQVYIVKEVTYVDIPTLEGYQP